MFGLTAATLMHVALLTTAGGDYQAAFKQADKEGKPLLVLVGTNWCPGCRVMKSETIPEFRRIGGLKDVVFTQVDADAKPELSRKLLRGSSIPQLVLYTRVGKLWRRTQLTGAHTPAEIRSFLKREIAKGRIVAEKASHQGVTQDSLTSTSNAQSSIAQQH